MGTMEPGAPPPPHGALGHTRQRIALLIVAGVLLATAIGLTDRPRDHEVRSSVAADATTSTIASDLRTSADPTSSTSTTLVGAPSSTEAPGGSTPSATGTDGSDGADTPAGAPGPPSSEAPHAGGTTGPGPTPPDVTTTTVCADSFEPACGPFRWTTASAPNLPLTVELTLPGPAPVVGRDFTVLITGGDGDAGTFRHSLRLSKAGEGGYPSIMSCTWDGDEEAFGPWAPPAPSGGTFGFARSVRALEPGTHWISACVTSTAWRVEAAALERCPGDGTTMVFEGWRCRDPYANFVTARIEIEVLPA